MTLDMTGKTIVILSSSTGGGHDMRAVALAEWVERLHGDSVSVTRWQILEESSRLDRFGVGLYNWIQRHAPWAHHLYFNFLELAGLHRRAGQIHGADRFRARLKALNPDVIVSTHDHLNHGYFELAKQCLGPSLRCLTYCGELSGGYGFSRHWVNPEADGFIAAVDACASAAASLGMAPGKTKVGGFLLRPQFFTAEAERATRLETRQALLGEDDGRPLLLLGTGANGANNHAAIIEALREIKTPLGIVALCGRNAVTFRQLEILNEEMEQHRIIPLAYRDDMAAILRAVDLAFVRPGTGTTSECIVCGCPIVFNGIGGVMPQERITLKYLSTKGIAVPLVRRPAKLAAIVEQWLSAEAQGNGGKQREAFANINRGLSPAGIVQEVLQSACGIRRG
jgi:processive 1,2-diacylglycerol beta-glucosyltransferase